MFVNLMYYPPKIYLDCSGIYFIWIKPTSDELQALLET